MKRQTPLSSCGRTTQKSCGIIFGCLVVLTAGLYGANTAYAETTPAAEENKRVLIIGKVSDNPKKHYAYLKAMADYVVAKMQGFGITESKVLLAKDNAQMVRYLQQDEVDWITETPASAIIFREQAGAEIILRKWKRDVPEYRTVFFARKESGIKQVSDLVGKTIAFEDPGSTTAFFLPAAVLLEAGLTLTKLSSPRETAPASAIGYMFSGEEINTSTWVHKGLVDAGAFSNLNWDKEDNMPVAFRQEIEIFHETRPYPRALELVNKNLPQNIKARLTEILLNAENDAAGREAMHQYQHTKRFDELSAESLEALRELYHRTQLVQTRLQ
ncbi:MAG: phosphate/phosphite/phosphonate ABC transporter substrate-binding protein [Gammaproteobacteria bacterium]|nr:phosphate/phosphite/phosphonate ABC transporter substrate-binding protein [Gammaproteobacteria bacterium]